MARKEVTMPALGMAQTTGTIVEWVKKIGDSVAVDEPIMLIETDKSVMELPSPVDGILVQIIVGEKIPVEIGSVVGYIETDLSVGKEILKEENSKETSTLQEEHLSESLSVSYETATLQEEHLSESLSVSYGTATLQDKTEEIPIPSAQVPFAGKKTERIFISPKARVLVDTYNISIDDLQQTPNITQPYDSNDVYTYMKRKQQYHSQQGHISFIADVPLEIFFSIVANAVDDATNSYSRAMRLWAKITAVAVMRSQEVLAALQVENNIPLNITEITKNSWKDFHIQNVVDFYSNITPAFEEGSIDSSLCIEYIEHNRIVAHTAQRNADIFLGLLANSTKKCGYFLFSIKENLLDKTKLLSFFEQLLSFIENPLLML